MVREYSCVVEGQTAEVVLLSSHQEYMHRRDFSVSTLALIPRLRACLSGISIEQLCAALCGRTLLHAARPEGPGVVLYRLEGRRLWKTFGFLSTRESCLSSSLLAVYSVIYLRLYGLRGIYFILWVTFWRCLLACSNYPGFVHWELCR